MPYADLNTTTQTPIGQLPYDYAQYFHTLVDQVGIAVGERFDEVDASVRSIAVEEIRNRLALSESQLAALDAIKRMIDADPNDSEALTEGRNLWLHIQEKFEAAVASAATFEAAIEAVKTTIASVQASIVGVEDRAAALASRIATLEARADAGDQRVRAILQGFDGMLDGLNAVVLNFRGRIGLKSTNG